jgi:DNA-binding CsgD family transcriptional regulator
MLPGRKSRNQSAGLRRGVFRVSLKACRIRDRRSCAKQVAVVVEAALRQRSSPREREGLNGLGEGLAYRQVADQLAVSIHTVRNYLRRICEKLHVRSRPEAVAKFLRK